MVITKAGVVNRQRVAEISLIGRATQGVKLVNLDKGDIVVDVARVVIEDAENGEIEGESPEGVAETTEAPTEASEEAGDAEPEAGPDPEAEADTEGGAEA